MTDFWPSLTFLFCFFNLLAWYQHGAVLFSWWWIAGVIGVQILLFVLTVGIAAAVKSR